MATSGARATKSLTVAGCCGVHYMYWLSQSTADSSAGWYAVVNGQKNIGLVENFTYFPDQEYPDGASVEQWNDGPGTFSRGPFNQTLENDPAKTPYFFETEGMSPYARLEPGEEYSYPIYWSPTRVTNPIAGEPSSGGIASEPLTGKIDGSNVTLKGTFGVFAPGTLQAEFFSAMGKNRGRSRSKPPIQDRELRVVQNGSVPGRCLPG